MNAHHAAATLGAARSQLQAGAFRVTIADYAPSVALPIHSHELASITAVLRGDLVETCRGSEHHCGTSSLHFRPAGIAHRNRYGDAGARCLLIGAISVPRGASQLFDQMQPGLGPELFVHARTIIHEVLNADDLSPLVIEGQILALLAMGARETRRAERHGGATKRWVKKLNDHIEHHWREPLTSQVIARVTGMHPAHATRAFRAHVGCTPSELVRRRRFAWAQEALVHGSLGLSEIALQSGFSDQSHFTRAFVRRIGVTPGSVRRTSRPARRD